MSVAYWENRKTTQNQEKKILWTRNILAEYQMAFQVLESKSYRNPILESKIHLLPLRQISVISGQNRATLDKSLKQGTKAMLYPAEIRG